MMNKLMSAEVAEIVRARYTRPIAFAPHTRSDIAPGLWGLTVVVKDETGHYPLPPQIAYGGEHDMATNAEDLNDTVLGLTRHESNMFVAASMRGASDVRQTA